MTILSHGVQITGKSPTSIQETGCYTHLRKWYYYNNYYYYYYPSTE